MGYMMSRGPFWLYSSLMSKCLLKGQGNGNINFLPPLRVSLDLTTPMCVLPCSGGFALTEFLVQKSYRVQRSGRNWCEGEGRNRC